MLIRREVLAAALPATSDSDTRFFMNAVQGMASMSRSTSEPLYRSRQ